MRLLRHILDRKHVRLILLRSLLLLLLRLRGLRPSRPARGLAIQHSWRAGGGTAQTRLYIPLPLPSPRLAIRHWRTPRIKPGAWY